MHLTLKPSFSQKDLVLVLPVLIEKKHIMTGKFPKKLKILVDKLIRDKEFKGEVNEIHTLKLHDSHFPKTVILAGLGEVDELKRYKVRETFALAWKQARSEKKKECTLVIPQELDEFGEVIGEAIGLSNYILGKFKTGKDLEDGKKTEIEKVEVVSISKNAKTLEDGLKKGLLIAESVNATRDMVNLPPNILTPKAMANEAVKIAKENGYKIKVFERKDLEKMGMGGILAVNHGSVKEDQSTRMVMIEYMPMKDQKPIVFIGKGIIFDSGGYNMKPSRAMENMHEDMAGGAAVFGVFRLLKKLKIQQNVIGIVPITENLVSDTAYKPTDIITTYSGKTVEITNTDAEGRMILCDALAYAEKNLRPRVMIDLATLTGACVVALGDRYAGIMGTDDKTMRALEHAGKRTDELVWELPMHHDHKDRLKSKIADIQNACKDYGADSQKGGMFLQEFVEKTPWVHVDIAGVAFVDAPKKYDFPQATGYGVRLLMAYLEGMKA